MLRMIFLAFLALALSATPTCDEIRERVIAFERPHDVFVRKLFGCELRGEISAETCTPSRGEIDYRAFRQAREQAKILYGLTEH